MKLMRGLKAKKLRRLAVKTFNERQRLQPDKNFFFRNFFRQVKRGYARLNKFQKANVVIKAK